MYRCKMEAYEGSEKYIFISYAHNDSDQVLPILDDLSERGYRIWYDDGIAPGSEWPEYIAAHLNSSELVLAFVSPSSIASPNCRREITFALSKKKNFIAIILEPTEMSLGMEMQLSAQRCIMKYDYSEQQFYSRLCSTPEMASCQQAQEVHHEKPSVSDPPSPPQQAMPDNGINASDMAVVEKMVEAVSSEPKPIGTKGKKPRKEKSPGSGKKRAIVLGSIAAVLVGIILAVIIGNRKISLPGAPYSYSIKSSYITLSDTDISNDTVNELVKFKSLSSLQLKGCTVTAENLNKLANLKNLYNFDVSTCSFSDYSFLTSLSRLSQLSLVNCSLSAGDIPDLSVLSRLNSLNLSCNPDLTALPALPFAKLSQINLNGTGIPDLTPLSAASSLRYLDIGDTAIDSLSPLSDLENLESLSFNNTSVTAVPEDFRSLSMKKLNFCGCDLSDLSGFAYFTILTEVRADDTGITDLPWLEKSAPTLTVLSLARNPISENMLTSLSKFSALKELSLDGVVLYDLNTIRANDTLERLSAAGCSLEDASAVSSLSALKFLNLSYNELEEISLSALTSLEKLNLSHNRLKDISELPLSVKNLVLHDNPIDITTMPTFSNSLSVVTLDYSEALLSAGDNLYKTTYNWCISGVPTDRKLALNNLFITAPHFVETEELDRWISESGSLNYYDWSNYFD